MSHDPASTARRAIGLLDLTELGDHATDDDVIALCDKAHGPHGNTAAVCVWPRHVALAVERLWGTNVRVATVVNFPSGEEPIDDVVAMTQQALVDGADFIKTSTGKTPQSATLEATGIMLGVIRQAGRPVGLKPSGGIRTLDDARHYISQADELLGAGWASPGTFRFGASGLLTALVAAVQGDGDVAESEAY
jgi:deoxyribose-phosphate aldolase